MPKRFLTLFSGLFLLGVLLTSCKYPQSTTQEPTPNTVVPLAWIDSPLDGMELPLGEYEIIAHGSDEIAVSAMEVSINDSPLQSVSRTNLSQPLVTWRNDWTPSEPGQYVIKVRAQNASGVWSEPAIATVWIVQEFTIPTSIPVLLPSRTPQPSDTVTPTVTATLTPTTTLTPTPQSEYLKDVNITPSTVSYYSDCPPTEIAAQVRAYDPDGIYVLTLYYRLKDLTSGETSDWYDFNTSRIEGGLYGVTFQPVTSTHPLANFFKPGLEKVGSSYNVQVQIQFVMQDLNQGVYRSDVYSMVTLYGCAP